LSAGRDRRDQQEENKKAITHAPILSEVRLEGVSED
jgi:hypothetical protein